ncbi:hypothetical protein DBY21_08135 [Candidatus Gastranaerophilales bacterium]|nr:MAG: hypothetical protein DBY21_08135 [Candidatus Gastranaerophilales bacterium]
MKYVILILLICFAYANPAFAITETTHKMSDVTVFSEKKKFGLKDNFGNIIADADYNKIIRLGETSWIIQKGHRFGLMDCDGNILIKPKYRHAERVLGEFIKLGNDNDYGIYNQYGEVVVKPVYTKIDLLFGGMFLTYKNFKYGVVDFEGKTLLENKFDDIYMPKPNIMRIEYNGKWYEIEQVTADTLTLPADVQHIKENENFKITEILANPLPATGYSVVTATDYFIKLFSSISPAYEQTIDELMLSQGADTITIFTKATWIPKFPFTYAKKYYINLRTPNNGPLSDVKKKLKNEMI